MASVPKGKDYVGGGKAGGVEEYCAAVRGADGDVQGVVETCRTCRDPTDTMCLEPMSRVSRVCVCVCYAPDAIVIQ